jgi:hypothetical protein
VVLAGSAVIVGSRLLRGQLTPRSGVKVGLIAFGAVLFTSALARPDGTHLVFTFPPALVLLCLFMEEASAGIAARGSGASRRGAAALFLAAGLAGLGLFWKAGWVNLVDALRQAGLTASARFSRPPAEGARELDLPRAKGVLVPERIAEEIEGAVGYVQSRTGPDEPLWAFPNEAMLNFLADRPLSNPFPLGAFAATRQQRVEMLAALERSRPALAIVFQGSWEVDEIPHEVALPEPIRYLAEHYEPEQQFGRMLVLRRK